MPFFVVHESGQPDRLFEVHTPTVIIGRGNDTDLVLPNVSVSRQHARLEAHPDGSATLVTLSDENPVYDKDTPLPERASLPHGTRVRIGRYALSYFHEAHLDLFAVQKLSEMPRFAKRGGNDAETHVISATLQRRLLQIEIRREFGELVSAEGQAFWLGPEEKSVGPSGDIPCPGRWGSGTAAKIQWAGAQHQVEKASMFAKLLINGEAQAKQMLKPGDTVEVNGATFTYRAERKRKSRSRPAQLQ